MNGAVSKLVSTYGQKPKKALQAAVDKFCPDVGEIIALPYIDASGGIVSAFGAFHDAFEEEGFSCDEAKVGFKIHILFLISHQTRIILYGSYSLIQLSKNEF